jgi:hypothetical protein
VVARHAVVASRAESIRVGGTATVGTFAVGLGVALAWGVKDGMGPGVMAEVAGLWEPRAQAMRSTSTRRKATTAT